MEVGREVRIDLGMVVVMKDGMEVGMKDVLNEGMEAGKGGKEDASPGMNWRTLCPPVSFLPPPPIAHCHINRVSELWYLALLLLFFCVYTYNKMIFYRMGNICRNYLQSTNANT